MRPQRIIMDAFGPFAGHQEVDFRELGDHSLFHLAGPTGAGKTFIMDAKLQLDALLQMELHKFADSVSEELAEALGHLRAAHELGPADNEAIRCLAGALSRAGELDEAITMWERSTSTLVPSRPRFSTLPAIPTARIMRSAVISFAVPSCSTDAVTESVPLSRLLTVAEVRIVMPCFSNSCCANAEISASSTGRIRGITSTTVTLTPRVL